MKKLTVALLLTMTLIPVLVWSQESGAAAAAPEAEKPIQAEGEDPKKEVGDAIQEKKEQNLTQVADVLFVFLVLSVVFEVALTPIFNWRIFLARFEGKGIKTPLTVIVALIIFWTYDLDILSDLLQALGKVAENSAGGQFITALLIAGGSDGIFRIFTRLGLRDPEERQQKARAARAEWLAKKGGGS